MRTKAATDIKAAVEKNYGTSTSNVFFAFQPIPDGVTELVKPEASRLAGNIATVPIMQGTNAQEARLFSKPYAPAGGFRQWVTNNFPASSVNTIVASYPIPTPYADDDFATAQAWTEAVYQCVSTAASSLTKAVF